ncbi:MAG: hypothetical protein ACK5II_14375, partial [Paracoccus sp. (in: a-proteobacteria)]
MPSPLPRFAPARSQSHLLRTTALLTIIPLFASVKPGFADLILDNDGTVDSNHQAVSGDIMQQDQVWYDTDTGSASLLTDDSRLVLSNPAGGAVTLDFGNQVRPEEVAINADGFTLAGSGQFYNDTNGLRFSTETAGTSVNVSTNIHAATTIGSGLTFNYSGDAPDMLSLHIESGAFLNNSGTTTGDMQVDGQASVSGQHNGNVTVTQDAVAGTSGVLNLDGNITGAIDNEGAVDISGTGTVTGDVANLAGGSLNNEGSITGDVANNANASLASSGTITGNLDNDGSATLSGDINGTLDNSASDLLLDGNLNLGDLVNSGSITVDDGQTLTSTDVAENTGTLGIDGDFTGAIDNEGAVDISGTGTVTGDVANLAGGSLNNEGSITGDVANNANASLA